MFACGCSLVTEGGRSLWGTSIRHLEKARPQAFRRRYQCSYEQCFDAVLALAVNRPEIMPVKENKKYHLFQEDRLRGVIVFMEIPGQVDTTEAGIFFSRYADSGIIEVEVVALSRIAQRKVAQIIFSELDARFIASK